MDQQALHDAFLREETRKVDKTGCVKFRGTLVEIGAPYAAKRITLRYAELPDGPHELTAYDGDQRIGPVTRAGVESSLRRTPTRPGSPSHRRDHARPARATWTRSRARARSGARRRAAFASANWRTAPATRTDV